jgi:hypothetical protein
MVKDFLTKCLIGLAGISIILAIIYFDKPVIKPESPLIDHCHPELTTGARIGEKF